MVVLILIGVLAFVLAFASDYIETRYVQAVQRTTAGEVRAADYAAKCSVAMWLVGVVGLVAVIEIGWWVCVPEGLGLYLGTRAALRRGGEV